MGEIVKKINECRDSVEQILDIFELTDGKIDSPYKAVDKLGGSVFKDGSYIGEITSVLKDKVEVYFNGDYQLYDYPVYYGVNWYEEKSDE